MSDDTPASTPPPGEPSDADEASEAPEGEGASPATKPKSFVRRHKVLIALTAVLVVIAASAGGYIYWINHQLTSIDRVHIDSIGAPADADGGAVEEDKDKPLNILLLGADNGQDTETVAADLKDGKWTPFVHRSDTLMVAHIPADRDSVQLISIPRDTWVPVEGYPSSTNHAKINAAFAFGGPALAVDTVEKLTGMNIDHMAVIDWAGFKDLTSNLGGVRVYIPKAFYDSSQRIQWEQGWQTLEGQMALAYVRTRYDLPSGEGDFGRIDRQQNFLRATMGKLLTSTRNIFTMTKVLNGIVKYLTIDDSWSNGEIRDLALSLRGVHSDNVDFLTAPFGQYATSSDGQSIVELAPRKSEFLFSSVDSDNVGEYLKKYPEEALDDDKSID